MLEERSSGESLVCQEDPRGNFSLVISTVRASFEHDALLPAVVGDGLGRLSGSLSISFAFARSFLALLF